MSQAYQNTDREIWRERGGDFYADSMHVTKDNRIGINCGGMVIVADLQKIYTSMRLVFFAEIKTGWSNFLNDFALWILRRNCEKELASLMKRVRDSNETK